MLRESERILSRELRELRVRIREAQRGERSRVKNVNKYIERTNREIRKYVAQQEVLREKEIAKLEKFLGDEFSSLTQARKAFKLQTAKPTKKELLNEIVKAKKRGHTAKARKLEIESGVARLDSKKPSYTIRQLTALEKRNVQSFVTDSKRFGELFSGYLDKDEVITVSVPYKYKGTDHRIHTERALGRRGRVFTNWQQFYAYLTAYYHDMDSDDDDAWFESIEIVKFPSDYDAGLAKARQTDKIEARHKELKRQDKEARKKIKQKAFERGFKAGEKKAKKGRRK